MRALLDVNVIIALLDSDHSFHNRAHDWWHKNSTFGWASCPISENGVIRIMSNPGYSPQIRFTPEDLISRLKKFIALTNHEFWPDDLTFRDESIFIANRLHSSRQLTDLYLLALAIKHQGKLATFDTAIPLSTLLGENEKHLEVI
jgi:toxin-antitoxin system PIN domain toxin